MRIPIALMRGGTSKGVFIDQQHMPVHRELWEAFLLDIMGSPDHRQIDGLGGGNSLTSKVAIIQPSLSPDYDIEYTFAQVSIYDQFVDFKGNCGNISSAVGPYAIAQGFVSVKEPVTSVRILNTNTNKIIMAEVQVENGKVKTEGCYAIPGVPGTGAPVFLSFSQPEGAVTGKLYPTGKPQDQIRLGNRLLNISIVDVANPLVLVRASDLGLLGTELPNEYTKEQLKEFEQIRAQAAEKCGFSNREEATKRSPAVPKLTIVAEPADYIDTNGTFHAASEMDLLIRMMSMQKPHQALAITGAICATACAFLEGNILSDFIQIKNEVLHLGHPAGIMDTKVELVGGHIAAIKVARTARMILEGAVYTKNSYHLLEQNA